MASQKYPNGFFDKMMRQAMDEITSGREGWRECETNTLILACFGHLGDKFQGIADELVKQQRNFSRLVWFFWGIIVTTIVGYFVVEIFNLR